MEQKKPYDIKLGNSDYERTEPIIKLPEIKKRDIRKEVKEKVEEIIKKELE